MHDTPGQAPQDQPQAQLQAKPQASPPSNGQESAPLTPQEARARHGAFLRGLAVIAFIVVLDQLSKLWILHGLDLPSRESVNVLPFLNFTMVWNRSISMGLPINELTGDWGLIALTAIIVLWLVRWLYKSSRMLEALALAVVIGGAVGNLIDRIVHGAVVDFVHLYGFGYHFYVFNVADAAITLGVVILLLDGILPSKQFTQASVRTDA